MVLLHWLSIANLIRAVPTHDHMNFLSCHVITLSDIRTKLWAGLFYDEPKVSSACDNREEKHLKTNQKISSLLPADDFVDTWRDEICSVPALHHRLIMTQNYTHYHNIVKSLSDGEIV